jgi:hypothetical protein
MANPVSRDLSDAFQDFLQGCAKVVLWLGGVAVVASLAFLVITISQMAGGGSGALAGDAVRNIGILQNVLVIGVIGLGVAIGYLFWGEEVAATLLLLFGFAMYFAPLYVPMLISGADTNEAARRALGAIQQGGTVLTLLSVVLIVCEVAVRVRQRATEGARADTLKFGKGIREDVDRQNVFLGKCWQLPFCRKFVRERCPIYHSRRTCWKEQTGCMCEEEVIRGAMENRPIPKDALLAAKLIPRNAKLTAAQKFERCKNCVIYNEHQRQKYRALLPVTLGSFVGTYALFRTPLLTGTNNLVNQINSVLHGFSLGTAGRDQIPGFFVELLLIVFFLIGLSYALKMLEFAIFKLKI